MKDSTQRPVGLCSNTVQETTAAPPRTEHEKKNKNWMTARRHYTSIARPAKLTQGTNVKAV